MKNILISFHFFKNTTAICTALFMALLLVPAGQMRAQCTVQQTEDVYTITDFTCVGQSFKATCSASLLTVQYSGYTAPNWVQVINGSGTTGTVLYSNTSPVFSGTTHTLTSNVPLTNGNSYTVLFIRTGLGGPCGYDRRGHSTDYPDGTAFGFTAVYPNVHPNGFWSEYETDLVFTFTLGTFVPPVECTGIHWTHNEPNNGQNKWKDLCQGYSACGAAAQSPVNIAGAANGSGLPNLDF
ncbi:MAG: hypothetical protein AAB316_04345, partial [Bacteroidota bacterium]